ncbi:MAG: hypothetical protein M1828_006504 [Chrysothrix sp. TS-e1954]|nr:MAG: hypothetical protein M1828_006504 [Chrysothrix sp. TS-e1954]
MPRQWVLSERPTAMPTYSGPNPTFKLVEISTDALQAGEVLVKPKFYSNDPAQRAWISTVEEGRLYTTPVQVGERMRARALAEVLESKSEKLKKGQLVSVGTGWVEQCVVKDSECTPVQELPGLSPTHYLGALGMTGVTAYYGLVHIARTQPTDAVVVSGAAGATGSMVVQIAKNLLHCKKVIGMAGTDEKCRWVESLGADICLNYKSKSFEDDLKKATTPYVEVYFDNVGGTILDLMLTRIAQFGRIAACGAISNYNRDDDKAGIKNWFEIVSNRIEVKGFIVPDHREKMPATVELLKRGFQEGRIKVGDENESVVDTSFEDIPRTWLKLFDGGNTGKLITKMI